jgi:hypothetical protein
MAVVLLIACFVGTITSSENIIDVVVVVVVDQHRQPSDVFRRSS